MIHISDCCHRPTFEGTTFEEPLGRGRGRIAYKITCCSSCGKECDELPACDVCGEPSEVLEWIDGTDHCPDCAREVNHDEFMGRAEKSTA